MGWAGRCPGQISSSPSSPPPLLTEAFLAAAAAAAGRATPATCSTWYALPFPCVALSPPSVGPNRAPKTLPCLQRRRSPPSPAPRRAAASHSLLLQRHTVLPLPLLFSWSLRLRSTSAGVRLPRQRLAAPVQARTVGAPANNLRFWGAGGFPLL